ncbi:MAG TPA: ABC transporter substrate-binding protein [Acidimicrobiia bacterium]|nr:ABC transporter substrate-binding protein [Acidimicrobiia bacterium]
MALTLVLAACGGGSDDPEGEGEVPEDDAGDPVPGGDLVYGIEAEADGINPTANNFAIAAVIMGRAVFDPLAQFDEEGVAQPYLAESIEPNADCTEWTITLRSGITFHDGTPLTSEAIKVHFETILAEALVGLVPKDIFRFDQTQPVSDTNTPITIVDDLTATVAMNGPNCNFPAWLTAQFGFIGSPTWIRAAEEDAALNQEPVGTGPFKFDARQVNARTKFVKNPDYWQEGLPYLDSVTFVVSTDGQVRAQSLKTGDFDIIHTTREDDIKIFRDDDSIKLYEDPTEEEGFLMFNHSIPPFDDVRARKAIIQATDRQQYVDLRSAGLPEIPNGIFHPDSPFYTEIENYPQHDPEAAIELATDYCGDFPENCQDGKIKFKWSSTPSPDSDADFDLFQEQWKDVAVIEKELIEQANYIVEVALGQWQATAWRQFGNLDPDYDTVWFDSRKIGPISINWGRIDNPELDRLIDEQRATQDFEERKEIWHQINETFAENGDYLWYTHSIWAIVAGDNVQSVTDFELPDGSKGWPIAEGRHNLAQIWISQ